MSTNLICWLKYLLYDGAFLFSYFQEMFLTHSDKVKVVIPLNLKSGSLIAMFRVAQNNYPNYNSEHDLESEGIVPTKVYL